MATTVELATAYVSVAMSTDGMRRQIKDLLDDVDDDWERHRKKQEKEDDSSAKKRAGAVRDAFANVAGAALKATAVGVGAALAGIAGVGIKTAAEMETARIGFETMLGSAEKAGKFLDDLKRFAAQTPFEFKDLQSASSKLISVGVDAERVIPIMKSLGNATAGMGTGAQGVDRALLALQQAMNKGKLQGEELLQLTEAGIPAFDLLAVAMGKPKEEIADLASKGKIGRAEIEQLLQTLESGKGLEKFAGMMEKQSASLGGMWSTLKDTFAQKSAEAMAPFIPVIKQGMEAAVPLLDKLVGQAGRFAAVLTGTVVPAARGVFDILFKGDYTGILDQFGLDESSPVVDALFNIREGFQGIWQAAKNVWATFTQGGGNAAASSGLNVLVSLAVMAAGAFRDFGVWLAKTTGPTKDLGATAGATGRTVSGFGAALGGALGVLTGMARGVGSLVDMMGGLSVVLPIVVGSFLALKAAQGLNTMFGRDSALGMAMWLTTSIALTASNFALARSNDAVAASESRKAAATNTGLLATLRSTAATVAGRVATAAKAAWTGIATAAQWAWNAALTANPIGLVVVAIIGLVAAIVLLWRNNEGFRHALVGAWNAIKGAFTSAWEAVKPVLSQLGAAVMGLWTNHIQPGLSKAGALFAAVWRGVQVAWETVLWPVLKAVGTVVMWLVETQIKTYLLAMRIAWTVAVTLMRAAWDNVLRPTFNAIATVAVWLWNNMLRPTWLAVQAGWSLLINGVRWGWDNVLRPTWNAVAGAARWLWDNMLRPVFDAMRAGWDRFAGGIRFVWDNVLRPVFNAVGNFVKHDLKDRFNDGVNGIVRAWERLRDGLKAPVRFVVETVINRGLIDSMNGLSRQFGGPTFNRLSLPGFATGGLVRGPGTGTSDSIIGVDARGVPTSRVSNGEYVVREKQTRKHRALLDAINHDRLPKYAKGGIVGGLKKIGSGLSNFGGDMAGLAMKFFRDPIEAIKGGFRKFLDQLPNNAFGDMLRAAPNRVVEAIKNKLSGFVNFGGGGDSMGSFSVAPGAIGKTQRWLMSKAGLPYQWGGVGNPSFDCSGIVSAAVSVLRGQSIRRLFTTGTVGSSLRPGPGVFTVGVDKPGEKRAIGHMAANLAGLPFESRGGGAGVLVGPRARAVRTFNHLYHVPMFDAGGVAVGTGVMPKNVVAPERVLSPQQTKSFDKWMDAGSPANRGGVTINVNVENMTNLDESEIAERIAAEVRRTMHVLGGV